MTTRTGGNPASVDNTLVLSAPSKCWNNIFHISGGPYAGLAAGDDGARVLGDSQPLKPGTHKVRGVRLLRDSPAADLSADLFNAAVERIICTVRPRGGIRTGAPLDDQSMAQLDELLMPPAGAMPPGPNEMEEEDDEFFK